MSQQQEIPGVDWDHVRGNYAVVRVVPKGTNSFGYPQVIELPWRASAREKVQVVFSTHLTLGEAQDALLRLVGAR